MFWVLMMFYDYPRTRYDDPFGAYDRVRSPRCASGPKRRTLTDMDISRAISSDGPRGFLDRAFQVICQLWWQLLELDTSSETRSQVFGDVCLTEKTARLCASIATAGSPAELILLSFAFK